MRSEELRPHPALDPDKPRRDHIIVYCRRKPGGKGLFLRAGVITPLPDESAVRVNSSRIPLDPERSRLLNFLTENSGATVPADRIASEMGAERFSGKKLSVQIAGLRRVLADDLKDASRDSAVIQGKYGVGYRFGDVDPTIRFDHPTGRIVEAEQIGMLDGRIMYYPENQNVIVNNVLIQLREQAGRLLQALHDDVGLPVPIETIAKRISPDLPPTRNAVDILLNRLRNNIEPDPENPIFIHTDRGFGYRLGEIDEEKAQQFYLLGDKIKFARHHPYLEVNGVKKILTRREHKLLFFMFEHQGQTLSRELLLREALTDDTASEHNVDLGIDKLRRKIEPDPQHPALIFTIPDEGYRMGKVDESPTSSHV
ncbi:MAG TPA: helix-turn-helix domain-containing protein [Candidatus Saccharimonadales bacterium]|nr:helix-turn-helix domain-containing protein [Candidatus Saccharimonadales bacterium]